MESQGDEASPAGEKPAWERALDRQGWPAKRLAWHKFTIQWFLSFCRKQSPPLSPNRTSANYFYTRMVAERRPPEWQKRQWKEAIGFYLDRMDPKEGANRPEEGEGGSAGLAEGWEEGFIRVIRGRHLSYRTEQTYLGWLKRFEAFAGARELRSMPDSEVRRFLSDLAVQGRVAASTQKQAFNALLFLYREVFKAACDEEAWLGDQEPTGFVSGASGLLRRGFGDGLTENA